VISADVLNGAQTSTEDLKGRVALATIYPGEQIIADKFGASTEVDTSPLQIPEGLIAVSVNLTDSARVSGFLEPGSRVAVFMSGTGADGAPFSRLLLPQVTVLGVGSTTLTTTTTTTSEGDQTTEQLPRTLLTVAVSQQDAQRMLFAETNGELSFGLLTGGGKGRPGPPVTAQNLFR
jgi:pilus assembly protein CpaB